MLSSGLCSYWSIQEDTGTDNMRLLQTGLRIKHLRILIYISENGYFQNIILDQLEDTNISTFQKISCCKGTPTNA